ncbi:uncharacterized protein LOC109871610 [Oncorhynchus kisutch]|uniref:uncharacterized protein LOC109871610 n=1 Tax=Oncorhynchus kisutch TaxID=8019 RepID=UPI0009A05A4C|nr:uncharacterized protein LOC109871610 [Oncorhynchus kisutch]XP_031662477.1 uncharacterized protein LOC109871610 [Oncorhynchus kisutch]
MSDYIVKIGGTGPEESEASPEESRDPSPEPAVLPMTDVSFSGAMEHMNEMLSSLDQVMDSQTQENGEQVEATESQRKRLKGNLGSSSVGCSLGCIPSFDSVSLTSTVNTDNNSGESLEQLQYQGALRVDTCDEVEVKVPDIDLSSFTLNRMSFSSILQEENDRVLDKDTMDCRSLSRTVPFESSPIPERSGSLKTYCSSVRSPTPYQSRLSLTSTEAHDQVAHSSGTQVSLQIPMDPLEELFGITQDMIYTDVHDRVIEVLQDIYLAANQLEQQLFQSVSDRQARAIVEAVVQQINAALSRALQQTYSGSQLLTIVGSAKLYSKDGLAAVEGQGVPLITSSAEGDRDGNKEGSRPLKRCFNSFVRVLSAKMRSISKGIKQSSESAQQEHRLVVELPASSDEGTEQEAAEKAGSSTVSEPAREEITEVSEVLQSESDDSLLPSIGGMLFHIGSMPHTEDSVELYGKVPSKLTPESMVQEERVDEGLSKACSRTTSSTSTTFSMDDVQKTVATLTTSGSDRGRSIITTPETPEQSLHHQGGGLDTPVSSERRVAESGRKSPATWSDAEGLSYAKKAVSELMERMVLSREDAASAEKSLDILLSSGILRPHTDKLVDQLRKLLMVNSTLTAQSVSGRSKSESALPKSSMTGELQREISRNGLLEIAYTITERSIKTLLEQLLTALLPPSVVVEVARSCQNIRPATPSQVMSSEVSPGCCNPLSMICRVIIDVFTITRQVVETASEMDMSPPGENIDGRLCSNTAPLPTDSTPSVHPINRECNRSLVTKPTNKIKSLTFSFPKLPKISLIKSKKVNQGDIAPLETTKDPADVDYSIFCTTPTPENAQRQEEDLASCSSQRKERPNNPFFLIRVYSAKSRLENS